MCEPGTTVEHLGVTLNSRKYTDRAWETYISVQSCDYMDCAEGSSVILDLGTNDKILDSLCVCVLACTYFIDMFNHDVWAQEPFLWSS